MIIPLRLIFKLNLFLCVRRQLAITLLLGGLVLLGFDRVEMAASEDWTQPRFEAQQIGSLDKGYGLSTGDVDGDGKLDVLLADRETFVWFRNGDWKRFVLADRLDEQGAMSIEARDIDGDGKVEIVICTRAPKAQIYWLQRPADPTQLWKPTALPGEPNQHRMRWAKGADGRQYIISVPIHARVKGEAVNIYAYPMPPDEEGHSERKLLIDDMSDMHDFAVVNGGNGQGEKLFFIGLEGVDLMGDSGKKFWRPDGVRRLMGMTEGLGEIDEGRTKEKHFLAFGEPKHGTRVVVYPADDQGRYGKGRQVLDDSLVSCHALECEDVLGLGRDQVIAGWWGDEGEGNYGIRIYIPMNDAATEWKTISVDEGTMACQSLQIADMDGDGDLDLVAAGWTTKNLVIFWNRSGESKPEVKPVLKK